MADDRDAQQKNSFHWPPTSEELESIQVIEVHDAAPRPSSAARSWWRRMIEGAVIAQVGLAAASIAAIGIAVTSLLAPAQPTTRAAKNDVRAAVAAQGPAQPSSTIAKATAAPDTSGASPTTAAASDRQASASDPSTFRHMVTFDTPPPAVAEVGADRAAGARVSTSRDGGERVARAGTSRGSATAAARGRATAGSRASAVAASLEREADLRPQRPRPAGTDPVSRFAKHTGLSVWKAMRAVGRSFKPDSDEAWSSRPATRSAGERRTAAAVNLAADAAPSAH